MSQDQYSRTDPTTQYTSDDFGKETIAHPGVTDDMSVTPITVRRRTAGAAVSRGRER
jgi:hypothetical protein